MRKLAEEPQKSTPDTDTPPNIYAITITRMETFDPLRVIEEATAQAQTERIVREHADSGHPAALYYRFEKTEECEGDFIDLVIQGEDKKRLSLVLARLRARDYNLSVEYHE
jgi:hypothetical protein